LNFSKLRVVTVPLTLIATRLAIVLSRWTTIRSSCRVPLTLRICCLWSRTTDRRRRSSRVSRRAGRLGAAWSSWRGFYGVNYG
jgi:hypothetical protein